MLVLLPSPVELPSVPLLEPPDEVPGKSVVPTP
jgi:hypothetical protein